MILLDQELRKVRVELDDCKRRLYQAKAIVEDNVEGVRGKGYKLKLGFHQTNDLWNLLSANDSESLAHPV